MPEDIIQVQTQLNFRSDLPGDYAINDWHFFISDHDDADLPVIARDRLEQWFNDDSNVRAPGEYVADMCTSEVSVRFRSLFTVGGDLAIPAGPFTPLAPFSLPDRFSSSDLPSQVAVVQTQQASTANPGRRQSHQNRQFFGPLVTQTGENNDIGEYRPTLDFREDLNAASSGLRGADDASVKWVVFSRTLALSTGLAGGMSIVGGFVDNAYDIQRRRQLSPTVYSRWVA